MCYDISSTSPFCNIKVYRFYRFSFVIVKKKQFSNRNLIRDSHFPDAVSVNAAKARITCFIMDAAGFLLSQEWQKKIAYCDKIENAIYNSDA
jgi:hypothetical protein